MQLLRGCQASARHRQEIRYACSVGFTPNESLDRLLSNGIAWHGYTHTRLHKLLVAKKRYLWEQVGTASYAAGAKQNAAESKSIGRLLEPHDLATHKLRRPVHGNVHVLAEDFLADLMGQAEVRPSYRILSK